MMNVRGCVAINHLDLCSGIGGWALAFRELGINTIAFCEIDKYPQQVLQKNFPGIPIFNDLKELTYEDIKERTGVDGIDILTCSYPCQPFSVAGKQKGEEDPRHLWTDTFRLVQECRPTWFVGENVSGHIKLGLDTVLQDLASEGYDTRTFIIPASSVGAWHKRERLWIIGHRNDVENANSRGRCRQERARQDNSEGVSREKQNSIINQASKGCTSRESTISESQDVCYSEHNGSLATKKSRRHQETARGTSQGQNQAEQSEGASRPSNHENVSDTSSSGLEEYGHSEPEDVIQHREETLSNADIQGSQRWLPRWENQKRESELGHAGCGSTAYLQQGENWWQTQSELCGVPDGISVELDKNRVGRIKGLGNAIVPQIAWFIGHAIISVDISHKTSDN